MSIFDYFQAIINIEYKNQQVYNYYNEWVTNSNRKRYTYTNTKLKDKLNCQKEVKYDARIFS